MTGRLFHMKLKGMVYEAGSQKAFAKAHGISEQFLHDILAGRREPGKKLLDAMGWERIITYQPKRDDCEET